MVITRSETYAIELKKKPRKNDQVKPLETPKATDQKDSGDELSDRGEIQKLLWRQMLRTPLNRRKEKPWLSPRATRTKVKIQYL